MFEIQEDSVVYIPIVAFAINAETARHLQPKHLQAQYTMANVSKLVKTVMTVCMKIIVCTIFVFPEQFSSKGLVAPIDPIHFYHSN